MYYTENLKSLSTDYFSSPTTPILALIRSQYFVNSTSKRALKMGKFKEGGEAGR